MNVKCFPDSDFAESQVLHFPDSAEPKRGTLTCFVSAPIAKKVLLWRHKIHDSV